MYVYDPVYGDIHAGGLYIPKEILQAEEQQIM